MAISNPPNQISEPLAAIPVYIVEGGAAVGSGNPLSAGDSNNAPVSNVVVLTPGTVGTAGRAIAIVLTVSGTVNMQLSSGTTYSIYLNSGSPNILPLSVTEILTSGTTAVGTYTNYI